MIDNFSCVHHNTLQCVLNTAMQDMLLCLNLHALHINAVSLILLARTAPCASLIGVRK